MQAVDLQINVWLLSCPHKAASSCRLTRVDTSVWRMRWTPSCMRPKSSYKPPSLRSFAVAALPIRRRSIRVTFPLVDQQLQNVAETYCRTTYCRAAVISTWRMFRRKNDRKWPASSDFVCSFWRPCLIYDPQPITTCICRRLQMTSERLDVRTKDYTPLNGVDRLAVERARDPDVHMGYSRSGKQSDLRDAISASGLTKSPPLPRPAVPVGGS